MFNLYWTSGIALISLIIGLLVGYDFEHTRFQSYKQSVIIAQKVAENETKREVIEAQQTTKEINDAYQHDIIVIRQFYTERLQHDSGGIKLPKISISSPGVNEGTPNQGIIGQCAETTLMLVDLQDWVKRQQILDDQK
jgi:hypothetical protein